MTTPELYQALEAFRVKDYLGWKTCGKGSVFHDFFHPANETRPDCNPQPQRSGR